jgi:hypothetical protein
VVSVLLQFYTTGVCLCYCRRQPDFYSSGICLVVSVFVIVEDSQTSTLVVSVFIVEDSQISALVVSVFVIAEDGHTSTLELSYFFCRRRPDFNMPPASLSFSTRIQRALLWSLLLTLHYSPIPRVLLMVGAQ